MTETCFHCGAGIPAGLKLEERVAERVLSFCCRGCHGAYLLISGAGLDSFYARRDRADAGPVSPPAPADYDESAFASSLRPREGLLSLEARLDGVRCAGCVWLLEKMIGRLPGVAQVRVNYATARASVLFDPAEVTVREIVTRAAELGYPPRPCLDSERSESTRRERTELLFRFGTAFFLTMQLMAYSFALYAGYFQGMTPDMKRWMQIFSLIVTTPVIFYCGSPFLAGAWRSVRNRAPDMELLVAVGALSSYGYSIYATLAGEEVYFETAAMIITLILAGRLLENAARSRAAGGIERLLRLAPDRVKRLRDDRLETVPVAELHPGDLILVSPGERFAVDGTVEEGATEVDQSPTTGEPLPVLKKRGDTVWGGSSNLTAAVRVRCEKSAEDSFLARAARLVEEAQSRKAPIQGSADRVAAHFVPLVLILGGATFCWHYAAGGSTFPESLMAALAVLVIACPCAVGLATPTAIAAGTAAGAAFGIIIKGGDVLERLSAVTAVAFDKTGTVTSGKATVEGVAPVAAVAPERVVTLAAAVEEGSLHPIGRAICDHARRQGLMHPVGEQLFTVPGGGVLGRVGPEKVLVGSLPFLISNGVEGSPEKSAAAPGITTVHVAFNQRYAGAISVSDPVRREAQALVSYFKGHGIRTLLLSGDSCQTAAGVARQVGIEEVLGEFSPAAKARHLEELHAAGETVLMVGDGINDAPALGAAAVGCAVAGGTDIAIETSDLVLARPDLERLARAHRLARRTMSVVRQNLLWAFVYNMVGIPLAMSGRLTPVYAAAAMALSSLCVVGNSLRLLGGRNG
ncbi:heavy metal translocating P-type ATPase [Geomonas sp. RF6]|uniref:heavy metal translocating P-type ATPase n=1 Tax=Geomonas sp. RF6 TaxID=2897342 RepID=UPI001E577F3B|nr:heavy metal translocating P-type ATPase [Geomonas sp. RF6]UFS71117.1 heavy metal translocating P-type ATPase [Geomonas sp. RF6]